MTALHEATILELQDAMRAGRLTPEWPEATIQQAQDVILRIATED